MPAFCSRIASLCFTVIIVSVLFPAVAVAQETGPATRAQPHTPSIEVMVLGTFHFTQGPDYNDVTAPEQQAEIRAVIDSLSAFRPTKLALEWTRTEAARFDSLYAAYRAGQHELTPNERQQLGFRLADRFDHDAVYPIDYKKPWGMQAVTDYAKQHEPWFLDYAQQWRNAMSRDGDSLHHHASIGAILRWHNQPETLDRIQAIRMRTLEVGADSTHIGVQPVASVYTRNLRIFANLTDIAEPGDRILLIFGTGHAYFFREFVRDHPHMTLVNPLDYL
jgi:hypothetical protein